MNMAWPMPWACRWPSSTVAFFEVADPHPVEGERLDRRPSVLPVAGFVEPAYGVEEGTFGVVGVCHHGQERLGHRQDALHEEVAAALGEGEGPDVVVAR